MTDLYRRVQNIRTLGPRDADHLALQIVDGIVRALQHDPAVALRQRSDWELSLASERQRIEQINKVINRRVCLEEVLSVIDGAQ
jgi:hypothetical protein